MSGDETAGGDAPGAGASGGGVATPVVAQAAPYGVDVKAGEKYFWCACGLSATQPFCDGAHKGTGLKPVIWRAEQDDTVWFCGCKATKETPFCDGSHNGLATTGAASGAR